MIRSLPLELLISCLILEAICVPTAAGPDREPMPAFVPDTDRENAPTLHGTTWVGEGPRHALWVKQVDGVERRNYIQRVTGQEVDPFVPAPERERGFLSFLLVLENRGSDHLEFNPLKTWLVTNKEEVRTPMGMTDISFVYRMLGVELPASYEHLEPALLNRTRSVAPDESISGLLVYKPVDHKTRRFSVDVRVSLPDGEVVKFSAPYRRLTRKEIKAAEEAGDAP